MRNGSIRNAWPAYAAYWTSIAYPRLREFPSHERAQALQRARSIEFDVLENLCMVAAVGFSAWLLQGVGEGSGEVFVRYLVQGALALPLLCCLIGPLLVRRTRRGLDAELAKRQGGV